MGDGPVGPSDAAERPDDDIADRRELRLLALGSILRVGLVTAVLSTLYAVAPLDEEPGRSVVVQIVMALLIVAVVMGLQIVAVLRSPYPRLRALEAVAVSGLLLMLLFASAYVVMGSADHTSFTEPVNRVDSIYFTVTIFSTVGFGDISAASQPARALVTLQMIVDLVLIGLIAKVLLGAVQERRQRLTSDLHRDSDPGARMSMRHGP
jgi:voltage-gated potassium channel